MVLFFQFCFFPNSVYKQEKITKIYQKKPLSVIYKKYT